MRSRLISEISPTRFFSMAMRALTISCRSFAALYSAFSRRSPSSRARWISFGSSTFSSRSSAAISSLKRFRIRSFIDEIDCSIMVSDALRFVHLATVIEPRTTNSSHEAHLQPPESARRRIRTRAATRSDRRAAAARWRAPGPRRAIAGASFESVVVAASRLDSADRGRTDRRALRARGRRCRRGQRRRCSPRSAPSKRPSGIVAIARRNGRRPPLRFSSTRARSSLVIVDVQDPGNVGALMRVGGSRRRHRRVRLRRIGKSVFVEGAPRQHGQRPASAGRAQHHD